MSLYETVVTAAPAITAICTVAVLISKVLIAMMKNIMTKFESEVTEKMKSIQVNNDQTTKFVKNEFDRLWNQVESKVDHMESGNERFRTEINDRLTRYEMIQIEQKDEIHRVEKEFLNYKAEIAEKISHLSDRSSKD